MASTEFDQIEELFGLDNAPSTHAPAEEKAEYYENLVHEIRQLFFKAKVLTEDFVLPIKSLKNNSVVLENAEDDEIFDDSGCNNTIDVSFVFS